MQTQPPLGRPSSRILRLPSWGPLPPQGTWTPARFPSDPETLTGSTTEDKGWGLIRNPSHRQFPNPAHPQASPLHVPLTETIWGHLGVP